MDFSFIIISHNSEDYIEKCLRSIKKYACATSFEIILVQNDLKEQVPISDENIIYLKLNKNKGFGHACNAGAKKAQGTILFFLNPDTEIIAGDLNSLKNIFSNEEIGAIAPKILSPDGNPEKWSLGMKPSVWILLRNNLGFPKDKYLWNSKEEISIDWVSGGALAIKKQLFDTLGGFDEKFFLYFEDIDLCTRLLSAGKKILSVPNMTVLHFSGHSQTDKKKQKRCYYESQDYFFHKHYGKFVSIAVSFLRTFSS